MWWSVHDETREVEVVVNDLMVFSEGCEPRSLHGRAVEVLELY